MLLNRDAGAFEFIDALHTTTVTLSSDLTAGLMVTPRSLNTGTHSAIIDTRKASGPCSCCYWPAQWASIALLADVCCRCLSSSSVTLPAAGRVSGRQQGRHCTAGQYGYVPLGDTLLYQFQFCIAKQSKCNELSSVNSTVTVIY